MSNVQHITKTFLNKVLGIIVSEFITTCMFEYFYNTEPVTAIVPTVPSDKFDLVLKTDNHQTLVLPHLLPSSSSCTEIEESNLISDIILDHDEYYKDPFNWPNNLNDKFISFCINKGSTFFFKIWRAILVSWHLLYQVVYTNDLIYKIHLHKYSSY